MDDLLKAPATEVFSDSSDEEKYGADEPDELYDEDADAADEKWVDKHFRKQATGGGKRQGPESDAVLNCPCCFSTLCMDCQRHDRYENQYRAMFVNNCTIKYNTRVVPPEAGGGKHSTKHKVNEEEKEKTGEEGISTAATDIEGAQDQPQQQAKERKVTWEDDEGAEEEEEVYYPVVCSCCGTEVGVQDSDEVVHFFNVIAS